jgi:type IV pilus assembly protein PilX
MVMLVPVLLLGLSAAKLAVQGEKTSRNDRDRQIAFQAAEAALIDAELDIEGSPDGGKSRSELFGSNKLEGFVDGCAAGEESAFVGLCDRATSAADPVWLTVDFMDNGPSTARTVPYGRFTGKTFAAGEGALSARLPRYIVELVAYNKPGESAEVMRQSYFYRITAFGFGARDNTHVVLQTVYRKED